MKGPHFGCCLYFFYLTSPFSHQKNANLQSLRICEKGSRWRWSRDLVADPHSAPPTPGSVCRPRYCTHTGLSFPLIYPALNSRAAELCFSPRQITPCLPGPLITNVCFINCAPSLAGTGAAPHLSLAVVPPCRQSRRVYLLCPGRLFFSLFLS